MQTLTIQIDDSIYNHVFWFLNQLPESKIIIKQDTTFNSLDVQHKLFLENELKQIDNGEAIFLSLSEVKEHLNNRIAGHENNS